MTNSSRFNAKPTESKLTLLEGFEEGFLVEWLTVNGKKITYAVVVLLTLLILVYRFSSSSTAKAEHDFIQAANEFAILTKASAELPASQETLQKLTLLMDKNPELHAAYDGTIGQILLNQGQIDQAKPFIVATLDRTKSDDLAFYSSFSNNTLLISEEKYPEALKSALALQQTMTDTINQNPTQTRFFGAELFAFNLFRIGMLQQQLSDRKGELATWKLWKQYAALEATQTIPARIDPQVFRAVIQQLAIGSISLPDYIAYREKELKE